MLSNCSKILWDHGKILFPNGALNRTGKNESRDISLSKSRRKPLYVAELDSKDANLMQSYCPIEILLQFTGTPKQIEHMNKVVAAIPEYRQAKVKLARELLEKYHFAICGDMVRLLYDYAVNDSTAPAELREISYAHIVIANPELRADVFHEIFLLGLDEDGLQAFLEQNFEHTSCRSAVILDMWDLDRYYVHKLPEKLESLAGRIPFMSDIKNGYKLHCFAHSSPLPRYELSSNTSTLLHHDDDKKPSADSSKQLSG